MENIIPKLFDSYEFSLNQLYDGLEYIGCEYEKIIEIYNHQIKQMYRLAALSSWLSFKTSSL